MYRAAWDQQTSGVRSGLFAALGLLALLAEVLVLYSVRSVVKTLPFGWVLTLPLTAVTGLVLWTSIPYLLLNRQVHWRRLIVGGAVSALGSTVYGVATSLYMPGLIDRYTREFGLFGITIAIIGWLLAVSGILVGATAIGAEFDRSQVHWALWLRTRLGLYDPAAGPPPPPPEGDTSGLTSDDLFLLARVLGNWAVLAAAVWAATALVPGIHVTGRCADLPRGLADAGPGQRGARAAAAPGVAAADGADAGAVRAGRQRRAAGGDRLGEPGPRRRRPRRRRSWVRW